MVWVSLLCGLICAVHSHFLISLIKHKNTGYAINLLNVAQMLRLELNAASIELWGIAYFKYFISS